jgi:LacI family transcriptional regulator
MQAKKVLMLLGAYDHEQHLGIARAARQYGWHLDISLLKTFRLPARWTGDGIICSLNNNNRLVEFVRKSGLPAVDTSVWRVEVPLPRVVANNPAIGNEAAAHFLERGHHSFAWFALERNPVSEARFEGYGSRLVAEGIRRNDIRRLDGRGSNKQEAVVRQLQTLPRPCAIFSKSDLDAAWLLNACLEAELKVPEDIAILGVDNNSLICENQPVPLSSINHDLETIGFEGARLLNDLMEGGAPPDHPLMIDPAGITRRQSTDSLAVSDPVVRSALEFIEGHLRQSLGVDEVAQAAGVPRRNLETRFRQALRMGVHGKILERRLKRAETMLRDSSESIETISAMTGFANAPHLSRTFKKSYGLSPLKYRQGLVPH